MKPYYSDDSVTIYHGDCRDVLPDLTGEVLFTDPPYIGREDLFSTGALPVLYESMNRFSQAVIFWPVIAAYPPGPLPTAVHIWHKAVPIHPNSKYGEAAGHQYERILSYGLGRRSMVYRVAAMMPGFAACKDELTPHPTQKPLDLLRPLIGETSGLIIDPFMGSGSTLRAAKDMDRHAIGIEVEERWCEVAAKRMAQETLGLAA